MDDSMEETTGAGFGYTSLQAVRKKLLDLTGRNQLINYKHPKVSSVRIVDELPDQIFEELQSGKTFTFEPVPDPTEIQLIDAGYLEKNEEGLLVETKPYPSAEKWARHLGIAADYALPAIDAVLGESKHADLNIQTLMYATELEARLRAIRSRSETAIEESGSNVLYLVLGFLEWYESRESDVKRMAPLFTLPVKLVRTKNLDKEQGVFRYVITLKDEGLLSNVTLRQKLALDFDLVLPEVGDDAAPEEYFARITEGMLKHQPRWKVHRMATLAILNFSKQVMYADLDPVNWPDHCKIEDHPIIRQFFEAQSSKDYEEAVGFAEEFDIDEIPGVHEKFPLIYEADSSQHSALIDATNGECLVIEGPPGSGKSQTITNLIAACIANGKRVLFVAEKMAALEVVKSRLDRAGLGDFCLELHSHKTQKQRLLADLKNRLDKHGKYKNPQEIDADIARYEDLKNKLNRYVSLINAEWKQTGLSAHQIFNAAARYREELNVDPESIQISDAGGQVLSSVRRRELADYAKMLVDIYLQVQEQAHGGVISNHHWCGVNNVDLLGHQQTELATRLERWDVSLQVLQRKIYVLKSTYGLDSEMLATIERVRQFIADGMDLPTLKGGEPLSLLRQFVDSDEHFNELLDQYEVLHMQLAQLEKVFKAEAIADGGAPDELRHCAAEIRRLGVADTESLAQIHADFNTTKALDKKIKLISDQLRLIYRALPENIRSIADGSLSALKELQTFIQLVTKLPPDLWRHRDALLDAPEMDDILDNMKGRFPVLVALNNELAAPFKLEALPPSKELNGIKDILQNAGIFAFFSKRWWAARRSLFSLSSSVKPDKKQLRELLPKLVDYKRGLEEVDKLNDEAQVLGSLYQGIDTPLERIVALRDWYRSVREKYGRGLAPRAKYAESLFAMDRDLALSIADLDKSGLTETIANVVET